jgi:hypothetical protein
VNPLRPARLYQWKADGSFLRTILFPETVHYDLDAGSVLWAGNALKPSTPPALYCPNAQVIPCAPPTGSTVEISLVVSDPDPWQTLSIAISREGQEIASQAVPASSSGTSVRFHLDLPTGDHEIAIEVSDGQTSSLCTTTIFARPDSFAPTIEGAPSDITLECPATPAFAVPEFGDSCDADPTITKSDEILPVSGKEISKTRRTWIATDDSGNSVSVSQTITVVDTTPPAFSKVPTDTAVTASSFAGAVVNYEPATASDACSAVTVSYSHPIAARFPIGTTVVTVAATDSVGNQAVAQFSVVVSAPNISAQLDTLSASVSALPIKDPFKKDLLTQLSLAKTALERSQPKLATDTLQEFEKSVQFLQKTKKLTADQTRQLVSVSQTIRTALVGA